MINPILKLVETGRYDVTYLFQYRFDEDVRRAKTFFAPYPQISLIGTGNRNRYNLGERQLQLEIPLEVFNAMDLTYYRELERLLRTAQFDMVQVEHSWMSWVVPLIRRIAPDLPVVLDLHNVESTVFHRWIQYAADDEREEITARWEKMRHWEEETWQWYDACLSVSPLELEAYQAQTCRRIPTWELPSGGGIDLDRFPRTESQPEREKETILSLGTMEWSPNVHGLLWFIDEVMPLLKQAHPHAHLGIAGFGMPDSKLMQHIRGRKDIAFLGEQEDERPLLDRSQVFIVPLWIGAGVRVKILTAWAAGIPVVSTALGAEGLPYSDGENIFVADEPSEFAEKIARVMEDEDLVQRLSRNGRALIEERYSLEYSVKEHDRIYSSIAEKGCPAMGGQHTGHDFEERERTISQLLQLKTDIPVMAGTSKHEVVARQSLVWKMPARYDRVVNRLLPQGTGRRGAYNLALNGVRTIHNEGWRSFFWKLRYWLRSRSTGRESQKQHTRNTGRPETAGSPPTHSVMRFPPYEPAIHKIIVSHNDPVRLGAMALAITRVRKNNIDGSFAEAGVWRGDTSRFIHLLAPERTLYLFDTFEGFPCKDRGRVDDRFRDTSEEIAKKRIGDLSNIAIRKGYFPDTAKGLENEVFAFVLIDLDLYKPTLDALQFFYPRTNSGGYIFVHDYNSPESSYAVSRATNEFMKDKPEKLVEMPDLWGSIVIRRI